MKTRLLLDPGYIFLALQDPAYAEEAEITVTDEVKRYIELIVSDAMNATDLTDMGEITRCHKCRYWDTLGRPGERTYGRCAKLAEKHWADLYMTTEYHYCGYGEMEKEEEIPLLSKTLKTMRAFRRGEGGRFQGEEEE